MPTSTMMSQFVHQCSPAKPVMRESNMLYGLVAFCVLLQLLLSSTSFENIHAPIWEASAVLGALCIFMFGRSRNRRANANKKALQSKADGAGPAPRTSPAASRAVREIAQKVRNSSTDNKGSPGPSQVRSPPRAAGSQVATRAPQSDSITNTSEPNLLITAVRKGRSWEVPKILDQQYDRHMQRHHGDKSRAQHCFLNDVLTVLRTCVACQQYRVAVDAYDYAADRLGGECGDLWSLLLYNCVEAGAYDRCAEVYGRLVRTSAPSNHDFVNVVRALAHFQDLKVLEKVVEDLRQRGSKFNTITRSRVLTVCAVEHDERLMNVLLAADDVFEEEMNTMNFNSILKGLARRGNLKRCVEIRDEMLKRNLEPTQMTFGILLDACARSGDFVKARSLFEEYLRAGGTPNSVHYTTVIKGLVNAGRMSEVVSLLEEMEASPQGAKPDIVTYQKLIKAYADRGELGECLRTLKRVTNSGLQPDRIMFESVLQGCRVKPMSSTEILGTFEALVSQGLQPVDNTLSVVVNALSLNKKWSAALSFLGSTESRFNFKPEARLFGQLGLACLKVDDWDVAGKVFEEMSKSTNMRSVGAGAMSLLFRDCIRTGSLSAAKTMISSNAKELTEKMLSRQDRLKDDVLCSNSAAITMKHLPSGASPRFAQFIEVNKLDDRCVRFLTTLDPAKVQWVMDQEFILPVDTHKGTASAMVVSALNRAKHLQICWEKYPSEEILQRRHEAFVDLNSIPSALAAELSAMPNEQLRWLMDQEFLVETKAPDALEARVRAMMSRAQDLPIGGAVLASMLEEFIDINQLDGRCSVSLRNLPMADAAWVMDQEWRIHVDHSRGNASAKVVGLLSRLRTDQREQPSVW